MHRARLTLLHRASTSRSCYSARRTTCSAIANIREDIAAKRRSAVEVVQSCLDIIKERESRLDSFLRVDEEGALQRASEIDKEVDDGAAGGPLLGVPVAIKDNICTAALETTGGSKILRGYLPAYDATVVAKLRAAGAIIIGKTNCDEFGMGSSTENSAFKLTRNAWSADHVPGGSSGGSASAVAGGEVPIALGSDTGGSVRLPAHFNGCVGLKPTYGRVSRHGLLAYASSLDCIGPLSRSVQDAATVLGVIAGQDRLDSTSLRDQVPDYASGLLPLAQLPSAPLRGLRVGVIDETLGAGVSDAVRAAAEGAIAHLESLGALVTRVSLPSFAAGLPAYYVIASSEASSNLARYDGVRYGPRADAADVQTMYRRTRQGGFGPEVKRRVLMGTYALSAGYYDAFYKKAQQVRTRVRDDFDAAFRDCDVLVSPVSPTTAFRFGERTEDPVEMYAADLMTVNLNMAGLPAVCLNAAFSEVGGTKLPVGIQLIGPALGEHRLLQVAHAFELTCEASRTFPT